MSTQAAFDTDNMNLKQESWYALFSDIFDWNWKLDSNCYTSNNLHEKYVFTLNSAWRIPAVIHPTAVPRCS